MTHRFTGDERIGPVRRLQHIGEATVAALAGVLLVNWRFGMRARFSPVDAGAAALMVLGLVVAVTALIAARFVGESADRRNRGQRGFWMLTAFACVIWGFGRASSTGASRTDLALINGACLLAMLLLTVAIGRSLIGASSSSARRKLALDLIPHLTVLGVIIWLLWLGPQTLSAGETHWLKAIDLSHGLGDFVLISLCVAGIVGRGQRIVTRPSSLVLNGVGFLALGDVFVLPAWERGVWPPHASSRFMAAAGLLMIGIAAAKACVQREQSAERPTSLKLPSAWTGQLSSVALVVLLAIAFLQARFGEPVAGGIATTLAAAGVVCLFNMIRQSLTLRHERRMQLEIDELSSQVDGLVRQVGRDPLTGLLNHRAMHERLEREIDHARLMGAPLAIALIDVDNFKTINDQRGHQAGDRVLRVVASILTAACRASDVAARYAGDEFMLILPGLDEADAARVCERIVEEVRRVNHDLNLGMGRELAVTLSVGVAVTHRRGRSGKDLIALADAAMYDAKDGGKDRVVVVNAESLVALSAVRDQRAQFADLPLLQAIARQKDRRKELVRVERMG